MSNRYVFSYFTALPDMDMAGERILVSLWRQNWLKAGLTPIVLTEWHASRHPIYVEFDEAVSRLPSTNPPGYDRSCFMRWLAVQVAAKDYPNESGTIAMADYDVLCYPKHGTSFYLDALLGPGAKCLAEPRPMHSMHGHCPALVIGTPDQFADVVKWFMDYVPPAGLKHQSDQYLFEQMILAQPDKFKASMDCVLYGEPGWEKAAAVHFSNSSMTGKTPKWQHIATLR